MFAGVAGYDQQGRDLFEREQRVVGCLWLDQSNSIRVMGPMSGMAMSVPAMVGTCGMRPLADMIVAPARLPRMDQTSPLRPEPRKKVALIRRAESGSRSGDCGAVLGRK